VAETVLTALEAAEAASRRRLLNFMARTRVTAVFEILLPTYQHVVDLRKGSFFAFSLLLSLFFLKIK
jgi:hypothetical protein